MRTLPSRPALALLLGGLLPQAAALAHSGHDHGAVPAAPLAAPAALPAAAAAGPQRRSLAARAVADPRRATRVAADQAGTLRPPPGGFPQPGQSVRAGSVLAYLEPALSVPERRDLDAELTLANRDVKLGALQVKRFNADAAESIDIALPTPSLQILGEYRSALARQDQLGQSLSGRIALVAPSDAVVAQSRARQDRRVEAGERLFELAPADAVIEFPGADESLDARRITHGQGLSGQRFDVILLADGYDPALRARRLLYSPAPGAALALGEPVRLLIEEGPAP